MANGVKWIVESHLVAQSGKLVIHVIWYAIFMGLVFWAISALFREPKQRRLQRDRRTRNHPSTRIGVPSQSSHSRMLAVAGERRTRFGCLPRIASGRTREESYGTASSYMVRKERERTCWPRLPPASSA